MYPNYRKFVLNDSLGNAIDVNFENDSKILILTEQIAREQNIIDTLTASEKSDQTEYKLKFAKIRLDTYTNSLKNLKGK
jgi:uncharacterized protein YigA (DUF484 family)